MPVTPTVCDAITTELITRLETLTVEGTEQTTVSEVVHPRFRDDYTPQHLQIVVRMPRPEISQELSRPGNPPATAWLQTYNLHLHVIPSKDDTETPDEIVNRFIADVRKVVCNPASSWHTFDGNAINAEWQTIEDIDGESMDGVVMPLLVTYRTDENNPYQVRA